MDGLNLALVFPSDATARKWTGALEARLRRAPLEQFLRTGSLKLAGAGAAQTTDNLTRATVFIVEAGLQAYCKEKDQGLATAQLAVVGHFACLVCRAAAAVIQEPATWRVPALVSTTLLLRPWIGDENRLSDHVAVAVIRNNYTRITHIAEIIAKRLAITE
jgi:hypothetical protein